MAVDVASPQLVKGTGAAATPSHGEPKVEAMTRSISLFQKKRQR
jgi:hypothetical protein